MAAIQLSLYGKTSWERFHQMTGLILEPCCNLSQIPKFQCLLVEDGQMPEWCEGDVLTSHGGSWTPDIGESPRRHSDGEESLSWQILQANVPEKFYLSPALCTRLLKLAQIAGIPPPPKIEYLLMKQGGQYPLSIPFKTGVCEAARKKKTTRGIGAVSDDQLTLFPPF